MVGGPQMTGGWKQTLAESVRKWEARPQYSALTPQVLATVPDDLLEQAIVDFVLNFREWPDDRLTRLLRGLPAGFSTIYTTWMLDAEVSNGGFHQYFWNSAGVYAELVQEALVGLGTEQHRDTFEQAVRLAGLHPRPGVNGLPLRAQMEAFSESALVGSFDHLDARWFELGALNDARVRFIRSNPTLFLAQLPRLARLRLCASALWNGRRMSR